MAGRIPYGMIVPTVYGQVLVNRFDTNQTDALVKTGRSVNHSQITSLCRFLESAPEGAVAVDAGANFGLYSLAFAHCLAPKKGRVFAFEAQRVIAYMLAGTTALNAVENLLVFHQAVGAIPGRLAIPRFDYNRPSSFGSIEFGREQREFIGQLRNMEVGEHEHVDVVRLDDLGLEKVHLLKIDVEGMEEAVLAGGRRLIERDKPVMCIEWFKADKQNVIAFCKELSYRVFDWGTDLLCVHAHEIRNYGVDVSLPEV